MLGIGRMKKNRREGLVGIRTFPELFCSGGHAAFASRPSLLSSSGVWAVPVLGGIIP